MEELVIEIKNLKKYYGKTRGVEDVSIKIKKGDIYGFIGPNGAGKSTTIRTLIGLINKTSGEIKICGKEFDKDDIDIKKKIGYLPSEINLYSDLTVSELLKYHESFYPDIPDIDKKKEEIVSALKIDESKKIEDLSLGNKKKVGIVLALMHSPEILILDEPTSGLDPIMQNIFHNLLKKEQERGATILYSSHILSEISSIATMVGFIKDGIIIKEDSIENIKKDNFTYLIVKSKDIEKIKEELNLKIIKEEENEVKFLNAMNPNEVIKILNKYDIERLLIEEISLEDLFIHYYM